MGVLLHLKSLVSSRVKKRNSAFSCPVSRQREFLADCPAPADDLARSYQQYRCQMKLEGRMSFALYTLGSLALLPVYRYRLFHMPQPACAERTDGVFLYDAEDSIIADSLRREFPRIVQVKDFQSHFYLSAADKAFLAQLRKRYPTAFFFRFKCMLKLGMYRWFYETYHPKALIVSSEYSFTSSCLTAYCEFLDIEHINVMHGEKLFYIRDSFFHFHRCYIWDEGYRKLFAALRAEATQFRVELPPALKPWDATGIEKTVDYTYYLQAEDGETLKKIAAAMRVLREQGKVVAVRPHPLYSDLAQVRELFPGCLIEDQANTDIRASILRTRHAISLHSTVLYQAYVNHVTVVIDDISNPAHFEKMQEMQYHMLHMPHLRLSACMAD